MKLNTDLERLLTKVLANPNSGRPTLNWVRDRIRATWPRWVFAGEQLLIRLSRNRTHATHGTGRAHAAQEGLKGRVDVVDEMEAARVQGEQVEQGKTVDPLDKMHRVMQFLQPGPTMQPLRILLHMGLLTKAAGLKFAELAGMLACNRS